MTLYDSMQYDSMTLYCPVSGGGDAAAELRLAVLAGLAAGGR